MVNQNGWITTSMVDKHTYCPPLVTDLKCDVLIVGGGFSGVSAAAEFLRKGLSVVLIEKNIVGGSSSGRSAGFLTPDSESELRSSRSLPGHPHIRFILGRVGIPWATFCGSFKARNILGEADDD
jgi:heterodisulfide reductase subunit A-like polyferredoxin